jgi:hypothetical protein
MPKAPTQTITIVRKIQRLRVLQPDRTCQISTFEEPPPWLVVVLERLPELDRPLE